MRRTIAIIAVVVAAGAGIWLVMRRGQATVDTATVLPAVKAADDVVAEAQVVPVRGASLSFTTGGVAAEVPTHEGDRVAAGQVLIRLASARQAAARVAQAEAALERARARLAELRAGARPEEVAVARAAADGAEQRVQQAESALRLAGADLQRAEQLYNDGILARGQVEQARATYETASSELEAARAELRRARAQLDLTTQGVRPETLAAAEADLASAAAARLEAIAALTETELRAPFAGTVAALEIKANEFVTPGAPVVYLADTSGWMVETTDLTELGVARIREGDLATMTFDALPDLTLTGHVTGIKTHGENRQGDIVYTVTIRPDRHEPRLYWNMTASVAIKAAQP